MRSLFLYAFAILVCGIAVACSSVRADTGKDAYMQVRGAQFVRGPMPAGSPSGPSVAQLTLMSNAMWPGLENDPLGGALAPTATAAAIGLQGDVGYWIVTAKAPDLATPANPSFAATLSFSRGIVVGDYTLVVRAVDEAGTFGLPATRILTAEPSPTNPPATGELVVTLEWDTNANLGLHVVDPNGAEIYWGSPSSQPPFSFSQADGGSYGYLDWDSNGNCVIDGLRREDAIWTRSPPPGRYVVRVDAPSLCGQPIAYWKARALLRGIEIAHATGVALETDTMGAHGVGSGVLAFELTVP